MAQLNLRDRVIEVTIGCIGARPGAASESLGYIRSTLPAGRAGLIRESTLDRGKLLTLDVRPIDGPWLHDCGLSVRLLAPNAPAEAVTEALDDVDALIAVLDGGSESEDSNRGAIELARATATRPIGTALPVVVELAGGAPGDLALGSPEEWPCVRRGSGETDQSEALRCAVTALATSLQGIADPTPAARDKDAARDAHPLLQALRKLVQTAVHEELAAHEARMTEKLERMHRATESGTVSLREILLARDQVSHARADMLERDVARLAMQLDSTKRSFE